MRLSISDTVECFPHGCAMPFGLASENVTIVLNDLLHAFTNPALESPFINIADKHIATISDLNFFQGGKNEPNTNKENLSAT